MRRETLIFDDSTFVRYPEAKGGSDRVYYIATTGKWVHRRLHDVLWEMANGPIPEGFHVHHVDGNPSQNVLENFDCLSPEDHARWHGLHMSKKRLQSSKEGIAKAQELAKVWHGSPEGKIWHSLQGQKSWSKCIRITKICKQCRQGFLSPKNSPALFCSPVCKAQWRRIMRTDDESRICVGCGQEFRVNRYTKTRYCSRSCAKSHSADAVIHILAGPTLAAEQEGPQQEVRYESVRIESRY